MKVMLCFFFLTACNSPQPEFVRFTSAEYLPFLEKCFKDFGVKYKVQNNSIYVDDPDKASDNCS
jgi:hypothetical protein